MAGNYNQDDELVSGINVTPLVDVVLVLLIIFLITAPVIYQSAIKVQLPKAKSGEESSQQNPLSFVITKEGDLVWNKQKESWDTISAKLQAYLKKSPDISKESAQVAADQSTPHGTVVKLMDVLRQNGILRFALTVDKNR